MLPYENSSEGLLKAHRGISHSICIVGAEGYFEAGDLVSCLDPEGKECARGLVNYSSAETRLILGQPSSNISTLLGVISHAELIHRDNLVVLN